MCPQDTDASSTLSFSMFSGQCISCVLSLKSIGLQLHQKLPKNFNLRRDKQTNRRMDGWYNSRTDGWMDKRMHKPEKQNAHKWGIKTNVVWK